MTEIKLINLKTGLTVFILTILLSMTVGFASIHAQEETDDVSNTSIGNEDRDGERDILRGRLQNIKKRGDEVRSNIEGKREEVNERLVERKEKLEEKRKQRILAYADRIFHRMDAAIERLLRKSVV